jgi:putative oxidoreductase
MILTSLTRFRETGLLLLRVALGLFFIYAHGWPKLAGGLAGWEKLGHSMQVLHIHLVPAFWGFMAAFSESIGAALFVLGLFFRPACILLVITMTVASLTEVKHGIAAAAHAIELGILFFSLIFIGPGKYSIDKS